MKQLVKLPNVHCKIVIDLDGVQALKKAQIKVGKLQNQVKKLLLKNSELRANLKESKNAMSSHSVPSDNDKLIAQQAKKFGVMNEVFVSLAALAVKQPPTNSIDPGWYNLAIAELHGMIAEIYESLPDDFHNELENSLSFQSLVSTFHANASHHWSPLESTLLSSVRQTIKLKSTKYHPPVLFQYCAWNIWSSDPILSGLT